MDTTASVNIVYSGNWNVFSVRLFKLAPSLISCMTLNSCLNSPRLNVPYLWNRDNEMVAVTEWNKTCKKFNTVTDNIWKKLPMLIYVLCPELVQANISFTYLLCIYYYELRLTNNKNLWFHKKEGNWQMLISWIYLKEIISKTGS